MRYSVLPLVWPQTKYNVNYTYINMVQKRCEKVSKPEKGSNVTQMFKFVCIKMA